VKIAIAQLNPTVGDFDGNLAKMEDALASASCRSADLVVFSELFLTGYPPRDLLERDWFFERAHEAAHRAFALSEERPGTTIIFGTITRTGREIGKGLHNSAMIIHGGKVLAKVHKSLLPTYDVFDEARYFDSGVRVDTVPLGDDSLGVTICEDAWNDPALWRRPVYGFDPVGTLARLGATIHINVSASPFSAGKDAVRYRLASGHAKRHGVPFVLANQVGGNDELVFDGGSMAVAPNGKLWARLPAFEEAIEVFDTSAQADLEFEPHGETASVHDALVLGLRDYVRKCGFEKVVVGLSGGIDSALVCALAARALGPENVLGVTMPSPFSSRGSVDDSAELASRLGVRMETVPIDGAYAALLEALGPHLDDEPGVTEENIQARVRGTILMAFSNERGHLPLSTGNKSEMAVGYCTLYGDMSGGLSVISDVPKTMVYELARHVNRDAELIPRPILEKEPSAELRPDQRDQDTLPPYDVLDRILDLYIDAGRSFDEIVAEGIDPEAARWVIRAANRNEYKRRQAAPGLKVTSKAFGVGRRMPIAARYEP